MPKLILLALISAFNASLFVNAQPLHKRGAPNRCVPTPTPTPTQHKCLVKPTTSAMPVPSTVPPNQAPPNQAPPNQAPTTKGPTVKSAYDTTSSARMAPSLNRLRRPQPQSEPVVQPAPAPQLVAPAPFTSRPSDAFKAGILAFHNTARFMTGAGLGSLEWDDQLANDALAWSQHQARIRSMVHSSNSQRPQQGENLWSCTSCNPNDLVSVAKGMGVSFVEQELPKWIRDGRPAVSGNNYHEWGHYTQIVWKSTKKVGCASASNGNSLYVTCRYFPSGNTMGQRPY